MTPRPYRLIVTGPRDLHIPALIRHTLWRGYTSITGPIVVVHGDCPGGVDADTKAGVLDLRAAGHTRIDHEPHPADWDHCGPGCPPTRHRVTKKPGDIHHPGQLPDYCPYAGPRRNAAMVALGADQCVAFPPAARGRSGTRNCMSLARKAGIPVTVIATTLEQQ